MPGLQVEGHAFDKEDDGVSVALCTGCTFGRGSALRMSTLRMATSPRSAFLAPCLHCLLCSRACMCHTSQQMLQYAHALTTQRV